MGEIRNTNLLVQFLNVYGIILVVLGHSELSASYINPMWNKFNFWIYSFHMPLFFFLSGFLFNYTYGRFLERGVVKSLKMKIKRLIYPYFFWGTILFFIKNILSVYSKTNTSFTFQSYIYGFLYPQDIKSCIGYLWFIVTLFIVFFIVYMLFLMRIDLTKNRNIFICVLVSFFLYYLFPDVSFLNLNSVFKYFVFFAIGIFLCNYRSKLSNKISIIIPFCCLLVSVLCIRCCNIIWINALVGIAFSVVLGLYLLRFDFCRKIVAKYAVYTYSIYLLHWLFQNAVKVVYVDLLGCYNSWVILLMFVTGVIIPIIICICVDKINVKKPIWVTFKIMLGR